MNRVSNHIANQWEIIREQQAAAQETDNAEMRKRHLQNAQNTQQEVSNYAANYGVCRYCGNRH